MQVIPLFTSADDIKNIKIKDSENGDKNLRQDGLLNDDSFQLIYLSTSVSTLAASTSSSENSVDRQPKWPTPGNINGICQIGFIQRC